MFSGAACKFRAPAKQERPVPSRRLLTNRRSYLPILGLQVFLRGVVQEMERTSALLLATEKGTADLRGTLQVFITRKRARPNLRFASVSAGFHARTGTSLTPFKILATAVNSNRPSRKGKNAIAVISLVVGLQLAQF